MKRIWEYAKKHPYMIGGIVLVVFLLMAFLSSGDEEPAGGTVMQTGPSDAQIASNLQLSQMQIAAGLQNSQLAAQKEVALAEIASKNRAQELQHNIIWQDQQTAARKMEYDNVYRNAELQANERMAFQNSQILSSSLQMQNAQYMETLKANWNIASVQTETQMRAIDANKSIMKGQQKASMFGSALGFLGGLF